MQYLSDEWLAAADLAVKPLTVDTGHARVGFVITGGPAGDRSYELALGTEESSVGPITDPDVTLTLPWDVAASIARGHGSAQRAVLDGAVRIGGDIRVLLGRSDELSMADDVLADLRSRTSFG